MADFEAMRTFVAVVKSILADVEDAHLSVANVREAPQGTLRVACTLLFGHLHAVPLAAAFMRKYPGVEIEIVASNRRVNKGTPGGCTTRPVISPRSDAQQPRRR